MDSAGVAISGVAAEKTWLDPDNLNLRGKQKDDLSQLILLLQSRQGQSKAVADCLLGKSSSVSQPVESMRRLVAEVDALAPKPSRETTLAILGRVVGRWNTVHSPQLPLPEFPVRMPKPVPPFTSGRWAGLTRYRGWADAVLNDIVQSAPAEVNDPSTKTNEAVPEGIENCVARVLASAVLWGGILCHKYLEELYSSLSRWPEISECASKRVYVVWFDGATNGRRWMPDAITTLVMMRLKPELLPEVAAFTAKHRLESILLKYFRTLFPNDDLCPYTLAEFIDSSLLHFELRLPRCLTEYAAGRSPSVSPNPITWARMVQHKPLVPKTTKITGTVIEEQNGEGDEQPESPDERDDWLAELRQLLGSGDSQLTPSQAQKAIKVRLRGYKGGQLEHVFLRFSADILLDYQRGRLKTVRDLVTALAKKLPAAVDLKQPGAIPPDTLVSAYSFLLDDAETPSQHKKLRGYLRSWHRWLVRTELSQPIDETEVFGNARQAQTIDARLIMEDEYLKARDSLVDWKMTFDQEADLEKDIRQIAGLILILGYRTGLRKSELWKCPLNALMLEPPAELLVRPWSELKLKTPNAVRKISLYALLDRPEKGSDGNPPEGPAPDKISKDELKLLETWARRRQHQNARIANPSPFLFYTPALDRRFIPEGRIFPLIHEALREITRDEMVHFHTLRKSGAGTWLAFALLKPPNATLPGWFKYWPEQEKRIKQATKLHRDLYLNEFATRRHLFATARNLGHSSPEVSTQNYLELQGDLLGLWLDSDLPDLEVEQISALAGVSQRSAYNYRNGDLYKNLWEHIARKYNQLNDAYGGATGNGKSTTTPSKLNKRPSIREQFYEESPSELVEIQELLSAHAQGSSKEDLLMRSGYSEAFVDALLDIAGKAAELTVVKPPQDRTAERTVVQDLSQDRAAPYVHSFRNSAREKRSVCPITPWTEQDVAIITKIGPKIFDSFRERRPELLPIARHWLESHRDERNGLEFSMKEQESATQYANFLDSFELLRGKCSLRYFGSEEAVEKWKEFLPSRIWRRRKPVRSPSESKAESNSIGIKVLLGAADKRKGGASQTSAYGWHYLMLLVSLWTVALETASPSNDSAGGHTASSLKSDTREE